MEQDKKQNALAVWKKLLPLLKEKGILWVGLVGAAVLLLTGLWEPEKKTQQTGSAVAPTVNAGEYETALEERLRQLLTGVEGVGELTVMVTVAGTEETVYAQSYHDDTDRSETAASGVSTRTSTANGYVLLNGDGGQQALTETVLCPEVRGVAVVCDGGADAGVRRRIVELVSTVLGIPSNRICVTK